MLPVNLLPAAVRDFDESFDWYLARSVMSAQRFASAVGSALKKIAAEPERFMRIDQRHRECRVQQFPFRVVFRVEPDRVIVVAIAHAKRRPNYWRGRLGQE